MEFNPSYKKTAVLLILVLAITGFVIFGISLDNPDDSPQGTSSSDERYSFDFSSLGKTGLVIEMTQGKSIETAEINVNYENQETQRFRSERLSQDSSQLIQLPESQDKITVSVYNKTSDSRTQVFSKKLDMESLREPKKQDIEVPNITISTNETLSLNGSSYTENQKDEYFWDMGDSSQYDTQLINHSYNSPGEYAVELLALSKGSSDSSRYVFNVTATREIVLKEFSIPDAIQPNTTLRLDATEFVDTDLADTTWIIDDEIFTNSTVEYTFREEKRYDVELVVERTDREGEILSQSVIVDKALGSGS